MIKLGLITNPHSTQNRRGLDGLRAVLAAWPDVLHAVIERVSDLPAVLDDFARQDVTLLAISGGDGTAQAAMTDLLERRPFATAPPLVLLPRGNTNMTATDIGAGSAKGFGSLKQLLATVANAKALPADRLVRRRVLRLENLRNWPTQRGMFFGGLAVYQAVELCRTRVHPLRIEADWAAGLTLAKLLLSWAFGGARAAGLTPARVPTMFEDGERRSVEELLVLATTLDRLVIGSRPFWNDGNGTLRYTAIAHPPRRLLCNLYRVLWGGADRRLPQDYFSRGAERVELSLPGPFTLDGQFFEAASGRPLILSAPDSLEFVRL